MHLIVTYMHVVEDMILHVTYQDALLSRNKITLRENKLMYPQW
jgi:hypothetical protein